MEKENIVCWFSCGVTSTIAIKIALDQFRDKYNFLIYYFKIDSAHPDNERFIKDCEIFFNHKIIQVQSEKYKDQFDVVNKTKYVNGAGGARCTLELKKNLRFKIEKEQKWKYQVFGFEFQKKEINRALKFIKQYPNSKAIFPLIENKLTKKQCLKILMNNNIEIPTMYKLGYKNNNCIGCVKGGAGYWNKIRVDFPEYFEKMIESEHIANHSCLKKYKKSLFLKDLDKKAGHKQKIDLPDCGNFCDIEFMDSKDKNLEKVLNEYNNIKEFYQY